MSNCKEENNNENTNNKIKLKFYSIYISKLKNDQLNYNSEQWPRMNFRKKWVKVIHSISCCSNNNWNRSTAITIKKNYILI